MNQYSSLTLLGRTLVDSLTQIETYETSTLSRREKDTIHVPTIGSTLSTAYEQLRNASEYAEDHLLQQRAIRRYLKRVLSFHAKSPTKKLGEELIAELTQSEYISNDYITKKDVKTIDQNIKRYYDAYWQYAEKEANATKRSLMQTYVLDMLAVRCEEIVQSHLRQLMFAHFAFTYLQDKVNFKKLIRSKEKIAKDDYPIVLYIAVHRAILKSNTATIRAALLDSYRKDIDDLNEFEKFNKKIDVLIETKTTAYVSRIVNRNGAALRFIYSGFFSGDAPIDPSSLKTPETLELALRKHIEREYTQLDKRLDRGIVRSIFFLLITKTIIGVAIEVPYDMATLGHIVWVPLLINLLFPATFIALTRLTLTTPVARNTNAVINQITSILFASEKRSYEVRIPKDSSSVGFNSVYAVSFLIVFAGLSYILYLLQFNIVQGIIFFVFLSTASFLAFRLSRQIHELEVVHASQGSLSLLRDIIYMPFIYVGQQISYRYSQANIVAAILDILIELPLKTILRLVRQWTSFLNDKKEELI